MAENEKVNHWRLLAAELGADVPAEGEVPPEAEESPPGQSESSPPAEAVAGARHLSRPAVAGPLPPRPTPARRAASDWGQLAQELGVDVPPELEPPEVPREPSISTHAAAEREDRDSPATASGPPSEPLAGDEYDGESVRPAAQSARDEERRGRKRRRRRRPSGGPEREVAAGTEESSQTEQWGLPATDAGPEDLDTEEVDPAAASDTASSSSGRREEGSRRGRRRRRRRGGSSGRESATGDDALRSHGPSPERSDQEESEPATPEDDVLDDDLLDEEQPAEAGARGEKSLHRAIPSWYDAVNVVISANLESRAKNPDRRPGNRPRGGHDRRGRERPGGRPN